MWFVEIHAVLCLEMAALFTYVKGEIIDICQSSVFYMAEYFQNCLSKISVISFSEN